MYLTYRTQNAKLKTGRPQKADAIGRAIWLEVKKELINLVRQRTDKAHLAAYIRFHITSTEVV